MKPVFKLIFSILVPLVVGGVSSAFTIPGVRGWYTTLKTPAFNPPNWLFAPVWTVLYIMMGIAFYMVWKSRAANLLKKRAMTLFAVQLSLNFLWSFIFFTLHFKAAALIEITILWISILLTILSFSKISQPAAWLLVPYICWVSFAGILTYSIWYLN